MNINDFNQVDISTRHLQFHSLKKYGMRNNLRDLYDQLIRRPFYKIFYNNFFKNQKYQIDLTIPEKGMSTLARRKFLNKYINLKNKNILNLGCGNAFDYHLWFNFKPKSIYGVDILNYKRSWEIVEKYTKKKNIFTNIKFQQVDILNIQENFLYDVIVSDAVFEHCKNFKKVAVKCNKLLKTGGFLYSSYGGPLWYTWAGDHFSGRDKEQNGYNHLLLNSLDYKEYFKENVRDINYELNQGGGGGILVQQDLFSKLSGNDYIKIFNESGFQVLKIIAEIDMRALKILKNNKQLEKKLRNLNLDLDFENFYLKTHIVYLKKIKDI